MISEKEKMVKGEMYNPADEVLIADRQRAKTLCMQYNLLLPNQEKDKKQTLKELLGKCGNNFTIEPNFFCDYGYNIEIGENFYSNHNLVILDCAPVKFGKNVLIGPNCGFYTARHPISVEERLKFLEDAKPITIGDNVWFGGNVVVLAGVNIGENAVIGAGSVVTKDIPPDCIAVGNPCKVLKSCK